MMNSWLSEQEIATKLRKVLPYTAPQILDGGPIFGMGYRPPWRLGNIVQAQIAKDLGLKVMLAQQSAREIERTKRTFQDVMDSATYAAFLTEFKAPWGADADHLKQEKDIEEAVKAGFTHFTYDVSEELKKGLDQTITRICDLYFFTQELKGEGNFSTEVSLDETEETTDLRDLVFLLEELKKSKVQVDEIAPRFPGYFEKGIDYYWKKENGQNIRDTKAFEEYLEEVVRISKKFGFRISIHSGSDKFSLYPIVSRITKNNFHLKTAGTHYLEELKIVAKHDLDLFREIYYFSLEQFQKDRATYELSTDLNNIPDLIKLNGEQIASLLDSGSGNDDLRQVLHVTYGSVLTAKGDDGASRFADRCFAILKKNEKEHFEVLGNHIKRHLKMLNLME